MTNGTENEQEVKTALPVAECECQGLSIPKSNTHFLNFLAVLIVLLIFAYVGAITFIAIPEKNIRFADSALTFLLATAFFAIITWAFRSSKAQIQREQTELQIKTFNGKGGTNA